ncbi:protein RGF1 INDUCIBLE TRANSCRIPTION FACTOR 1 isoform X1 [Arachis duranensis]|uniref:Protein RGF1 INDUCIBLE TRANSCRIPTION FACTOR 1 isoform X1 n=1 Tax=Arachis duranensis TaxID=130453 RepID=A0A9C6TKI3_ARADU|nr:protein RGF1 INDUCIBLE TRANSCRIPTION FACTOR 1 isoform X1 [Arachis duranensis]
MLVEPPWLEGLLRITFFRICKEHMKSPRNECNMFCLDCGDNAFCFYCKSSFHNHHQVIQIRRSSYHDVVRVTEIQNVLDISGVQTYVINSARVLFLNERPQNQLKANHNNNSASNNNNNGKSNSHFCEICRRNLLDPFRFCSLGCKLVGIKKNGNGSFVSSAKKEEEESEELLLREGIIVFHKQKQQVYQISTPCSNHNNNSRRRKGIPQRAPLGF